MNTLIEEFNGEYYELVGLRNKATTKRMEAEFEYRHEIHNLLVFEYQIESAKTMLRTIKPELTELNNIPADKLTNKQKNRKTNLEFFKRKAITELRDGRTYYRLAQNHIKLYKAKFHSARNEEAVMIRVLKWAYKQIDEYINSLDIIKTEDFLKQPLPVRQSKIFTMKFNSPVNLKIYKNKSCEDLRLYNITVYEISEKFLATIKNE